MAFRIVRAMVLLKIGYEYDNPKSLVTIFGGHPKVIDIKAGTA